MKIELIPYHLEFKVPAGTSRGVLKDKKIWFVKIFSPDNSFFGLGEVSILPNLSIDDVPDLEQLLIQEIEKFQLNTIPTSVGEIFELVHAQISNTLPAIRFALETALLDLFYGGKRKIFNNPFYDAQQAILINGLIWMGDKEFMLKQLENKLEQGFRCIKMKIGAIDFDTEFELLKLIREKSTNPDLVLRVDANGAFDQSNVWEVLQKLATLNIHSIEQPIKKGQIDLMAKICKKSSVPIVLDEELIGVFGTDKEALIRDIQPHYLIFKPSLLGGFFETLEWISLCEKHGIEWWITSALESNVGLNAIAQFTSFCRTTIPQGLGTGQLFTNNIDSPLHLDGDLLYYDNSKNWGKLPN